MFKLVLWAFKDSIINWVLESLEDPAFKERLVAEVNKLVDLPKMTEEEEKTYFSNLYNALKEALKNVLLKL